MESSPEDGELYLPFLRSLRQVGTLQEQTLFYVAAAANSYHKALCSQRGRLDQSVWAQSACRNYASAQHGLRTCVAQASYR